MSLRGERMSSRLGGVPMAFDIIEDLESEMMKRGEKKGSTISSEERKQLNKEVALAGLRISILRSKLGTNIDFDPDKSLSMEGDSGPYLCYTFARINSLLEKAKEKV
jgi:arginyl-tRNA synthetase